MCDVWSDQLGVERPIDLTQYATKCVERPLICGSTVIVWSDRYYVERPSLCGATVIMWSDRYYVERPLLCGATVTVGSDLLRKKNRRGGGGQDVFDKCL